MFCQIHEELNLVDFLVASEIIRRMLSNNKLRYVAFQGECVLVTAVIFAAVGRFPPGER